METAFLSPSHARLILSFPFAIPPLVYGMTVYKPSYMCLSYGIVSPTIVTVRVFANAWPVMPLTGMNCAFRLLRIFLDLLFVLFPLSTMRCLLGPSAHVSILAILALVITMLSFPVCPLAPVWCDHISNSRIDDAWQLFCSQSLSLLHRGSISVDRGVAPSLRFKPLFFAVC